MRRILCTCAAGKYRKGNVQTDFDVNCQQFMMLIGWVFNFDDPKDDKEEDDEGEAILCYTTSSNALAFACFVVRFFLFAVNLK